MRVPRLPAWTSSLLLLLLAGPVRAAASPSEIWVATTPAASLDAAFATGAVIRGRLPGAVIVADAASADRLARAGFPVDGPLPVTAGRDVLLLAPRPAAAAVAGRVPAPAREDATPGVRVLWSRGTSAVVEVREELPETPPFDAFAPCVLSGVPLVRMPAPAAATGLRTTIFAPEIDAMAADVDSVAYFPWIRRLAGAEPVIIGGASFTIVTRHSLQSQCDLAEQYVYERFQAIGVDSVAYDPFTIGSTTARNIVATQRGVSDPDQIVIVCGHLDSTSPTPANAPGGNDNASGAAAVLLAAEVMHSYEFAKTIRYVAFTGEEQGLYGSNHYAALVAASADSVVGVINMDMIAWWGTRHRIDVEGEAFCSPIMVVMADACAEYTTVATQPMYSPWGSDHVSFSNLGMKSFLAIESDYDAYPCYHRTCDTWDKNLGGFGAEVARAAIATAAHLAGVVPVVAAPEAAQSRGGLQVWPTPFGDVLTMRLARPSAVRSLSIHDVSGRRVRTLADRAVTGSELTWDGRDDMGHPAAAGIYFVRLLDDGAGATRKVVRQR